MSMVNQGARFLRWEKRCSIILAERSPREHATGRPDILGVTDSRHLLEIEIKTSVSDFRANAKKPHIARLDATDKEVRDFQFESAPKQFWYLVTREILEKIRPECPSWAGLMIHGDYQVEVVKPAPTNKLSRRLSIKECARLVRCMGNQMMSLMTSIEGFRNRDSIGGAWDSTSSDDCWTRYNKWSGDGKEYSNFQI